MKFSVKLQEHHNQDHQKNHRQPPLLLRAKIPITVFNLPFLSHFSTTTTHPSDLSLSLSTNFGSGPSLKLSYAATASSAAATGTPPLSLTLKSGTGLFGSPNNSPLVVSANFSFNPSNPNHPNPTFSLFFKPQLGSFSLRKSTFSHAESVVSGSEPTNGDSENESNSFGFVPLERPAIVKDLPVEKNGSYSIFKGIQLAARTEMPVAKKVALNFRWWVNFSEDQMPVLRINKIGIQRVDDVLKDDEKKKEKSEANDGEAEVLKGMCFWMKRELDALTRVNREMKFELEEMKMGARLVRHSGGDSNGGVEKKVMPVERPSSGFEQWRSRKNGGHEENGNVNGKKEEKKNTSIAIDVESELQRAIKAAAGSP